MSIPAGASKVVVVPGGLAGDGNLPAVLGIRASFAGYSSPIQRNVNVVAFESNTPTGGYRLPFHNGDLDPEVFIHVGAHANSTDQKWAYDIGARRWNEALGKWDNLTEEAYEHGDPGSLNEDFLIWELPVYAIGNGTIRRCTRSLEDHLPGGGTKGGNTIILELGNGEWASYHHLRQDSIPADLCPIEGGSDADWFPVHVPVVAGQLLGWVGDTGHSGGPHLHLQIEGEPPSELTETTLRPLPLNFYGMLVHHSDGYDPNGNLSGFAFVGSDQPLALHSNTLVKPTM